MGSIWRGRSKETFDGSERATFEFEFAWVGMRCI